MEIVILIVLGLILVLLLLLGYRLVRFILKNRIYTQIMLLLGIVALIAMLINQVFFQKMEFIPSRVYPDLYLIKNPVKDRNKLNTALTQFVLDHKNEKLAGASDSTGSAMNTEYSLRFYRYTKSWGINLFADAGTAYFIENEEDLGGFVVEELSMYSAEKLADFRVNLCANNTESYCGELTFYEDGAVSKTEVLGTITSDQALDSVKNE
ncbi:hypothetical protein [Leeuwenhoekiella sp. H156]|uniref:hypothetical protein n=1 Tax=Leeuwenhoekiella sp. H156 TaxID=3450128 RepID=UPI003FA4CCF8